MKTEELDTLLIHAHEREEAVLYTPSNGFELVPAPPEGVPPMPYFLGEDDYLDGAT